MVIVTPTSMLTEKDTPFNRCRFPISFPLSGGNVSVWQPGGPTKGVL